MTKAMGVLVLGLLAPFLAAGQDANRGMELYQAKNYEEAERVLSAAVSQDSNNGQAQLYYGLTLLKRNKAKEAEQALRKADQVMPGNVEVKAGLVCSYIDQRQLDTAEDVLKQASDLDANNPAVVYQRGRLKLARQNYSEAAEDLEKTMSDQPDNAYAHYYAGLAYNGLRRPDQAVKHFNEFLKMAPDAPEAGRVRALLANLR